MEIQVAKLRGALEKLKPVIIKKPTLEALKYVRLGEGKMVATDMETMIIVPMPEADSECLLPFNDVYDMLKYIQGSDVMHITAEEEKANMVWSDGKSSFPTKPFKDFPEVPDFKPPAEAPVDIDNFMQVMNEVSYYSATDSSRLVLNGVTVILGEKIILAAGDGFRSAYKETDLKFPEEGTLIVPLGAVSVLNHLYAKTPRNPPLADSLVKIITAKKIALVGFDDKNHLQFKYSDNTIALIKCIDGQSPDFAKLYPKDEPTCQVSLMGADMRVALNRITHAAATDNGAAHILFEDNTAILSSGKDEQVIESTIKTHAAVGTPNQVSLHMKYLREYFKDRDHLVTISWVSKGSPVSFQHRKDPRILIMPMFSGADNKK